MTDKASLRRHYTALRDSLPADERSRAEAAIRNRFFSLPAWKNVPLVCGYMSVRGEIDTSPIWERAADMGKTYALPVTVTDAREGEMIFRRLSGFTPRELAPARFGIREPVPTCPALPLQDLDGALILVPGLCFDENGYRLGYGGGYYDRFLEKLADAGIHVTTVGLTFSVCRAPTLPRDDFDRAVDIIIDERSMTVPHGIRA